MLCSKKSWILAGDNVIISKSRKVVKLMMNAEKNMIIIKGVIKTSEIKSCKYNYDTKKWDVQFNSGKIYAYNYENIECLKDPISLNPSMYRIIRDSTEIFDIKSIYSFKSLSSTYWHICFKNGSTRDYNKEELKIRESCLKQEKAGNVFEYIKQIADLSELRNEDTGENLLSKTFNKISFIENEVALAQYLNPSSALKRYGKSDQCDSRTSGNWKNTNDFEYCS